SVSAVAYLAQVLLVIQSVGTGLSVGSGIQISRAFGTGDIPMVQKRVSTVYAITAILGAAVLLLLPAARPILRLAGTPDALIGVGSAYFQVQLLSTVCLLFDNVYIAVERARGNSGRILRLNLAVILTKLSLTALFVYVLNGTLVTIALASLLSNLLLLVLGVRNSLAGEGAFCFSRKSVTRESKVVRPMLVTSFPSMLEKALFALGKTIVNAMSTAYGDLCVGAMGVSNNLGGITTNPQNGFQDGGAAIISQNYGAGEYRRVVSAFYATSVICMILGGAISGIELANLDALAGWFDSQNPEFHRLICLVYRYEALGAIPLGLNAGVLALLYGLGKTNLTLLVNLARVFVFRIPVFWILGRIPGIGERACGIVMLVSNAGTGVFSGILAIFVLRKFRKEHPEAFAAKEKQSRAHRA
ncbi:MAG: MATE family efflux transporter, partial [Lachnospiraceae bacterium]